MKPYPEYKDSGNDLLGRIPAHWNVMRLKRLGSIRYGLGEPPDYTVDGVPLIRATNVSQGRVTPEKLVYVNPEDIPRARIYWLRLGDIVVVRSGALTGDSATIDDEFAGSIAGFDMVFRANATVYHGFIQYSLLSPHVRESQIDVVRTRAAQPHLNSEELGDCILGVPPEGEQCAIADYLDRETAEIDAFIADQEELIALLNERRTATITQSLISGLKPSVETKESEVDWLGRVPEHWAVTSLKHAIDILPGYAFGSEDFTTADEDVRLLRGVNINPGRIVWGDVVRFDARERPDLRTYELREGDLALGLDRPVISTGVRVARLGAEDIFHPSSSSASHGSEPRGEPRWASFCTCCSRRCSPAISSRSSPV